MNKLRFIGSQIQKQNKWRVAIVASLLLGLVVSVAAFAGGFSVVSYDDVRVTDFKPSEPKTTQFIQNGHFTDWVNGKPANWTVPTPALTPGWEVHFAQVDVSRKGDNEGINNAVGMFFRTGANGSQFATMSQKTGVTVAGNYWVQLHLTAWEENVKSDYNSVAWYGFGTTEDPNSVTEWRELFPDTRVCPNGGEECNYLARKETVALKGGEHLHVRMGMKFPDHNAWTVFVVDDISLTDLSDGIKVDVKNFTVDGGADWDADANR